MKGIIDVAMRLIRAFQRAYARKWVFLCLFAAAFLASVVVLGRLDLLPATSPVSTVSTNAAAASPLERASARAPSPIVDIEMPTKITIPAINLAATVLNPTTTDVAMLDHTLLGGAVRYPTSARLGETGNTVLFGHSSYLPIVRNQAYKTFNGIQKLSAGDAVIVYSSDRAYTYRVRSVAKESAASGAGIPLSVTGRVLTLATCDSFGAKSDRFVVVADFVESHAISG